MPKPNEDAATVEGAPAFPAGQDPVNVRILKWVVIVLGVFLMAALVTVFGVIGYRLARPKPPPAVAGEAIELPVPPGTEIGQFHLDGNRVVVHLRHQAGGELVVIDVRSGKIVSRIKLRTEDASGN